MERIRVMIVDDHPVVRRGLRNMLGSAREVEIVGEASDAGEALSVVAVERPDVVLLDIRMPGMGGLELCRRLGEAQSDTRVVILTAYESEELVTEGFRAGAWGYLLKSASREEMLGALRMVHQGKRALSSEMMDDVLRQFTDLTRRYARDRFGLSRSEIEVLRQIAEGRTNEEIALNMHWSPSTVKRKISDVLQKMNVDDRTEAAAQAVRHGLV